MNATRQILLIAGRELRQRLRSKMFRVVTVLMALLVTGAAAIPAVGGALFGAAEPPEEEPATAEVPEVALVGDLPAAARTAIAVALGVEPTYRQLASEDEVGAALEDGADFAVADGGRRLLAPVATGPFAFSVPPGVPERLGVALVLEEQGLAADEVGAALGAPPVPVAIVDTGGGVDAETAGGRFAVAYAGSFFLYVVLIYFAQLIASGVIEEKGSRVVELLLPAAPPRQLLAGKLLGLGALGTGQVAVIVLPGLAVLLARYPDAVPVGVGAAVVAVVVGFVLGFALYAGVTEGLSAMASRIEDLQSVVLPIYVLLVAAFMVTLPVLNAPETTLATVATFVPFTAPFVVPIRLALIELPWWHAALGALSVAVTAVLLTLLAARLYEGSILRGGGRVGWRTAWRGTTE